MAVCSRVPEFAAYFRAAFPEVRGKTEITRPDLCFRLPRPAVLLAKIGLCSEVFDFSPHFRKTSPTMAFTPPKSSTVRVLSTAINRGDALHWKGIPLAIPWPNGGLDFNGNDPIISIRIKSDLFTLKGRIAICCQLCRKNGRQCKRPHGRKPSNNHQIALRMGICHRNGI